jgi:hypothetical protein
MAMASVVTVPRLLTCAVVDAAGFDTLTARVSVVVAPNASAIDTNTNTVAPEPRFELAGKKPVKIPMPEVVWSVSEGAARVVLPH